MIKKIILIIIIFLFNENNLKANESVKIILKINNQIITNADVENEYNYITALNNDFKKLTKSKALKIAKESVIKEKIKRAEIVKYYDLNQKNDNIKGVIRDFYLKLNLKNEEEFKNYLKEYNITFEEVKNRINVETIWNQLIYSKYKSKIKIDLEKLKKIIQTQKSHQNSYLLSEILFKINADENIKKKYEMIKQSIAKEGFKNSANIYSISDSAKLGGKIGWVNENQLSKNIIDKIKKIEVGRHTKPIPASGGFLLLKINDIKKVKINLNLEKELKKLENFEINRQLNQMSNLFFNKIKSNTIIDEL
jgi:peptidyl-prolyl cis-trans isomerase SurA